MGIFLYLCPFISLYQTPVQVLSFLKKHKMSNFSKANVAIFIKYCYIKDQQQLKMHAIILTQVICMPKEARLLGYNT